MQVVNQLRRQQLVLIGIVLLALQQEMQNGEMLDVLSALLVLGQLPLLLKILDQFVKEMSNHLAILVLKCSVLKQIMTINICLCKKQQNKLQFMI